MKKLFLSILLVLFLPVITHAQTYSEQIDNYDVIIDVNKDSSINVTERIKYNFGSNQKHGIYRTIPYRYERNGFNYNLLVDDIHVSDAQGEPIDFKRTKEGGNIKIRIGDPDVYVSGIVNYIIDYKISWAINYFNDHDELYWNIVGDSWEVPIKQTKATVNLPVRSSESGARMECFSGVSGSDDVCVSKRFDYAGKGNIKGAVFIDDWLSPSEAFTIVFGWDKGIVNEPGPLSVLWFYLKNNIILALPLLVFFVMYRIWQEHGRDPKGRGTIIAEYDAPDNLSPAEIGVILDEQADKADITAEIIQLAILGYIKIHQFKDSGVWSKYDYILERLKEDYSGLRAEQKLIMEKLFQEKYYKKFIKSIAKKDHIKFNNPENKILISDLQSNFQKELSDIKESFYKSVYQKGYFEKNPAKAVIPYVVSGFALVFISIFMGGWIGVRWLIALSVSGLVIIIFGFLMPKKTYQGAIAKEKILGLKEYLSVAEADRIKFHNAPAKNPARFEKLLPYAMVFKVEKEWAKQFDGIYKDDPGWYSGYQPGTFTASALAGDLGSFSKTANTTMMSTASSGGSGFSGGSSGGGFGGGGGGSW